MQLVLLVMMLSTIPTGWNNGWSRIQPPAMQTAAQVAIFVVGVLGIIWGGRIGLRFWMGILGLAFAGIFSGMLDAEGSSFYFIVGIYVGMIFGGTIDGMFKLHKESSTM